MVDIPAAEDEFVLDQWRLEKRARNRCMRMAADRFDACPLSVQNALRTRLIDVFFGAGTFAKSSQPPKNFSAIQL
jgi:hypothetical protein